jgi:hypothetical protein
VNGTVKKSPKKWLGKCWWVKSPFTVAVDLVLIISLQTPPINMQCFAFFLASLATVAAFAPSARMASSSALKMSFEVSKLGLSQITF